MQKTPSALSPAWLLMPLLSLAASFPFLAEDATIFLTWWLFLFLMGLAVLPMAAALFPAADRGYLLSKPLGLVLTSLSLWLASHLFGLPLSRPMALATLFFWCLFGYAFKPIRQGLARRLGSSGLPWRRFAAAETLFIAALLFWTFARGLKPELDSLEKFMNIGFMNSLWQGQTLPAADMWLAGHSINYYYYGHYAYTFLARMTGIAPQTAYNLALATTFALTVTTAYSLVSHALQKATRSGKALRRGAPVVGGLLGALLVAIGGNSHAFFYREGAAGGPLLSFWQRRGWVHSDPQRAFWFADPTRFIGYNPDTADKTIHEFPFYSFLVADLHAHVINLAFVLLFLALLLHLPRPRRLSPPAVDASPEDDRQWHRQATRRMLRRLQENTRQPHLGLGGVLLAVFMMCNFWDFAIYTGVAFLVLAARSARQPKPLTAGGLFVLLLQVAMLLPVFLWVHSPLWAVLFYALIVGAAHYLTILGDDALSAAGARISWLFFLAHALALPFNQGFEPISKEIAFTESRSPLWQLALLWGGHVTAGLLLGLGFALVLRRRLRPARLPRTGIEKRLATSPQSRWTLTLSRLSASDLFFGLALACGLFLILVPEVVYVVDIYSGEFKRANTMFKFTYQAFILLSLFWAYGLAILLFHRKEGFFSRGHFGQKTLAVALCLLLALPLSYPLIGSRQWLGAFERDRYQGLDGLAPLARKHSPQISEPFAASLEADHAAIVWLRKHAKGQPVILEAYGESYTDHGRISAFTGLPTVIGWETHQWLWRTSQETPNAYGSVVLPRQEDVRTLYTSDDADQRQALLEKYDIRYIILGNLERSRFADETLAAGHAIREDDLRALGPIVFEQGDLSIIDVQP